MKLCLYGNPILRTPIAPMEEITENDDKMSDLMLEAMYAYQGVGLAANQVGFSKRMFVYDIGDGPHTVINPILELVGDELLHEPEGCLSVPRFGWAIPRWAKVRLTGETLYGDKGTIEAEGLLARVFQHETDHLNGITLIQHLSDDERKHFKKQVRELSRNPRQEAGVD